MSAWFVNVRIVESGRWFKCEGVRVVECGCDGVRV